MELAQNLKLHGEVAEDEDPEFVGAGDLKQAAERWPALPTERLDELVEPVVGREVDETAPMIAEPQRAKDPLQ